MSHTQPARSQRRQALINNITKALRPILRDSGHHIVPPDLGLWPPNAEQADYPDVMLIEGGFKSALGGVGAVTNPLVVIEILPSSMQGDARGLNLHRYREIGTLQEYLLISQTHPLVEVFRKQRANTWALTYFGEMSDRAELSCIGCEVPLAAIYQDIRVSHGEL